MDSRKVPADFDTVGAGTRESHSVSVGARLSAIIGSVTHLLPLNGITGSSPGNFNLVVVRRPRILGIPRGYEGRASKGIAIACEDQFAKASGLSDDSIGT